MINSGIAVAKIKDIENPIKPTVTIAK